MPLCFYCKKNETLFQRTCKTCQMQIFFCDDCEDDHDCNKKQQEQVESLKQEFEQIKLEDIQNFGQKLILAQIFNMNSEGRQIQMILEEEQNSISMNSALNIDDQIYIPMIMEDCCQLNNNSILTSGGFDCINVQKKSHSLQYWMNNNKIVFKVMRRCDMNVERLTHKLIQVGNDRVVAIGGKSQQNYLDSIELYESDKDTWTLIGQMSQCRSQPSALFHSQSLYIYGGFSNQTIVAPNIDVYSFQKSQFSIIQIDFSNVSNQIVRSLPLVKDKDNILILGGSNGKECANHILNFNLSTNQLTILNYKLSKSRVYGEGFYNHKDQSITFIGGTNSEQNLSIENIELKESGITSIENVNYSEELQIQGFPHFMWLTLMTFSQ